LSSNFFKSSEVISEQEVRIINSNDIVAKQLEQIAKYVKSTPSEGIMNSFSEGLNAKEVEILPEDNGDILGLNTQEEERVDTKMDLKMQSQMASDIIQQANLEAEQIREKSLAEAEQLRKNTFEQAKQEGYQAGLEEARVANEKLQKELEEQKKRLLDEYRVKIEEIEPDLVNAITGVYEHIFAVDLSERREILMHLVKNTLIQMEGVRKFLLRISHEDYPYLSMQKKELVSGTGVALENIDIVEDFSMKRGQCIIETEGGIFDCGFGTHLDRLRNELKLLSYDK